MTAAPDVLTAGQADTLAAAATVLLELSGFPSAACDRTQAVASVALDVVNSVLIAAKVHDDSAQAARVLA